MKDKNRINVFVVVIIILLVGFFFIGKPGTKGGEVVDASVPEGAKELANSHLAVVSGALVATETFYDFGTISMKNGKVSKVFRVTNSTNADIKVPSLNTSCMCTTAYIIQEDGSRSRPFGMPGHGGAVPKANATVVAGGSLDIEVVYDPNAHGPAGVGRIDRFVYLEDDNGNKLRFEIKANVTP